MFADYAANQASDATLEKYYGKYPGVVIDDTGNSTYPLTEDERKRGELWVRVPGILEEPPDDNSPDGADPQGLEVIAKPCFPPGFFYVPEPGAHVWVEFAAGDINTPIWSGVWYPSNAIPPTVADSTPTRAQKVIRTGSGHVVQIDDTGDEEKIVIKHTSGAQIQIDKNGSILLADGKQDFFYLNADQGEITLADPTNQNVLTMKKDSITITKKGKTSIFIQDGDVVITAEKKVHIGAKDLILECATATIGKGADEPALLGTKFDVLWSMMINHTHGTALGPSTTPLPVIMPLQAGGCLSKAVKVK